jgi:hypothetical protein
MGNFNLPSMDLEPFRIGMHLMVEGTSGNLYQKIIAQLGYSEEMLYDTTMSGKIGLHGIEMDLSITAIPDYSNCIICPKIIIPIQLRKIVPDTSWSVSNIEAKTSTEAGRFSFGTEVSSQAETIYSIVLRRDVTREESREMTKHR